MENTCPSCRGPVEVWADNSDSVTVNFACDNPRCKAGKGLWDTPGPRPADLTSEDSFEIMDDMTNRAQTVMSLVHELQAHERGIQAGDIVTLEWQEAEHKGLVVAVTGSGVHIEVNGPRPRVIVMPPTMVVRNV